MTEAKLGDVLNTLAASGDVQIALLVSPRMNVKEEALRSRIPT